MKTITLEEAIVELETIRSRAQKYREEGYRDLEELNRVLITSGRYKRKTFLEGLSSTVLRELQFNDHLSYIPQDMFRYIVEDMGRFMTIRAPRGIESLALIKSFNRVLDVVLSCKVKEQATN